VRKYSQKNAPLFQFCAEYSQKNAPLFQFCAEYSQKNAQMLQFCAELQPEERTAACNTSLYVLQTVALKQYTCVSSIIVA